MRLPYNATPQQLRELAEKASQNRRGLSPEIAAYQADAYRAAAESREREWAAAPRLSLREVETLPKGSRVRRMDGPYPDLYRAKEKLDGGLGGRWGTVGEDAAREMLVERCNRLKKELKDAEAALLSFDQTQGIRTL